MPIQIQTTQNVTLDMRAAGLGPRILATLLDGLFIMIWFIVWLVIILYSFSNEDIMVWLFLIACLPVVFYDLLFEIFNNGQSPGKKILKIKVVNIDGTTPSVGSYLIRWLFRLVDFTLTNSILAVVLVAATEKSQRLGDILAKTTVISLKPEAGSYQPSIPDLDFHDNYTVVYSDVLEKLTDKDIATIRAVLENYRYNSDPDTLRYLAKKVKKTTDYSYEGSDRAFLKKIIDDYNYLSVQY
ncbi:RDD family protein [Viscerimonas tarda]